MLGAAISETSTVTIATAAGALMAMATAISSWVAMRIRLDFALQKISALEALVDKHEAWRQRTIGASRQRVPTGVYDVPIPQAAHSTQEINAAQ